MIEMFQLENKFILVRKKILKNKIWYHFYKEKNIQKILEDIFTKIVIVTIKWT